MGSCIGMTWLVTKCPPVDRFMYGYDRACWSRFVPWLMGSCMAINRLVTKCGLVDGLMYGYYLAGHEVSPG